MNLLVDMGNSRLKWAVGDGLELNVGTPILNAELTKTKLIDRWQPLNPPDQLVISCVSTNQLLDLVLAVANELWPGISINQVKSKAAVFGVRNAYPNPEKLGVDRWLAIAAAYCRYQKAMCLVGCGTAITVDVIDNTGQHLGGLISPGLRLMKESLAHNTENLGLHEASYPGGLANFTEAAIHNGTLAAVCGLIEHSTKHYSNFLLILTGGDADKIASELTTIAIVEPDLVLHGLALTLATRS
jgi:type III pantothenate kinase